MIYFVFIKNDNGLNWTDSKDLELHCEIRDRDMHKNVLVELVRDSQLV